MKLLPLATLANDPKRDSESYADDPPLTSSPSSRPHTEFTDPDEPRRIDSTSTMVELSDGGDEDAEDDIDGDDEGHARDGLRQPSFFLCDAQSSAR